MNFRLKKHAARWVLAALPCLPVHALQAQTNALPALAPAYPELPPTFWEAHTIFIIGGAVILVPLAILLIWLMLQPKRKPVLPPAQIARAALERMRAQAEDGKSLSEVSQILRRYVGATFGFPGGEMTTTEFLDAVASNPGFNLRFADTLSSLLKACDKDKFAAQSEAPPLNAVERALQLVELIEQNRRQPAATTKPNP